MLDRKPIFDEVRQLLGRGFSREEVTRLDAAIDRAAIDGAANRNTAPPAYRLGQAGSALIRKWEGCARKRADGRIEAYPDPGSRDGKPWTIGWGSTGADIGPGTVWTQEQCDTRFTADVQRFVDAVAQFLGSAPTTQNQFDALVSFHYNTGALASSTLGKLHKQGRFVAAQAEFARWIYNDRKPMNGLRSRRADEAALYAAP